MALTRLVDSSVWIAFKRLGMLEVLLKLPGLKVAPQVLYELRRGSDDLAEKVKHLCDSSIEAIDADDVGGTLIWIAQDKYGISKTDAVQVVYVLKARDTVLYMRDRDAERVAVLLGTQAKSLEQLVADLIQCSVISPKEARALSQKLDKYFG